MQGSRSNRWLALGLAAAIAVLVLVTFASVAFGTRPLRFDTVLDALFRFDGGNDDHLIVRSLRVPRTVVGLMVGIALGLAGAVMQGVTRNPLADPGILGVERRRRARSSSSAIYLLRRRLAARVRVVRVRRRRAGRRRRLRARRRSGREGATPVEAGPGRRRGHRAARHRSPRRSCCSTSRPSTSSGSGPSARSPAATPTIAAPGRARSSSSGSCWRSPRGRMLNALALGDDVARSLGPAGRARPRVSRPSRSCCCAARRRRPPADRLRRPHRAARRPGDHRARLPLDPAVLGGARADPAARRRHRRPRRSPGRARCRSASSPRSSARRSSSRSSAGGSWPSCDVAASTRRCSSGGETPAAPPSPARRRPPARGVGRWLVVAISSRSACRSASATSRSRCATSCRPSSASATDDADFIVQTLRLPRALTGAARRVAFGLSGAIFQSLARNPLASPDIIGITPGRRPAPCS